MSVDLKISHLVCPWCGGLGIIYWNNGKTSPCSMCLSSDEPDELILLDMLAQVIVPMLRKPDPLHVRCPWCGAMPLQLCYWLNSISSSEVIHQSRANLAMKVAL